MGCLSKYVDLVPTNYMGFRMFRSRPAFQGFFCGKDSFWNTLDFGVIAASVLETAVELWDRRCRGGRLKGSNPKLHEADSTRKYPHSH